MEDSYKIVIAAMLSLACVGVAVFEAFKRLEIEITLEKLAALGVAVFRERCMTGNRISRVLFFWPGALLIQLGQWGLAVSETGVGRYTLRPMFRLFCRFALYARPYLVNGSRTNDAVTSLQLDDLIGRHRLIAAIPCACRAGRPACTIPHHGDHDLDVCLSFGFAAIVQIGSGLGKRLSPQQAKDLCRRGADSGLVHHAIYSFGSLLEVCNCCAETCSVVRAYKAGVREAVRSSPARAVRGPECNGCRDLGVRLCEEVCPYGLKPSSPDCLGCGLCAEHCPRGAVGMVMREGDIIEKPTSPFRALASSDRAYQFSIRDLLIAITAVACVFGGFSIYGVTGASVVTLVLSRYLVRRGRLAARPWVFSGGVALMSTSIIVLLLMVAPLAPKKQPVSVHSRFLREVTRPRRLPLLCNVRSGPGTALCMAQG